MADGTKTDGRDLPSIEEFAAFLFQRGGNNADHAKRRLLNAYAVEWAKYEGVPVHKALRIADALTDEMTATADELQAEAS